MWKRIKFWTISSIIVALAIACVYLYYFGDRESIIRRVVDTPAVVKEIQRLSELVTVKYNIQKVIGLEEEKVPLGTEKILLMVQATVLGGIDLSALRAQDCTVDGNRVIIRLPPPKVLQVFVDDKNTKVWDRSKTWWTPWVPFDPELEQKARLAALEAVQAAALEMGLLTNAQQNAERTIREFLKAGGIESVVFETRSSGHELHEK